MRLTTLIIGCLTASLLHNGIDCCSITGSVSHAQANVVHPLSSFSITHGMNSDRLITQRSRLLKAIDPSVTPSLSRNRAATESTTATPTDTHERPYPKHISLSFEWNDRQHTYNLQLIDSLFASSSQVSVLTDSSRESFADSLVTYSATISRQAWIVATLHSSGLFEATLHSNGNTTQLRPMHAMQSMSFTSELQHDLTQLTDSSTVQMVAFTHESIPDFRMQQLCGFIDSTGELHIDRVRNSTHSPTNRRLLDSDNAANDVSQIARWSPDCFPSSAQLHAISVGIVVDYAMFIAFDRDVQAIHSSVQHMYASINAVYMQQLHVVLQIHEIVIHSSPASDPIEQAFILNPSNTSGTCDGSSNEMETVLAAFQNWRALNRTRQYSMWHLLSDCFAPPGIVGLAVIGGACSPKATLVASLSSTMWLTIAHETGHLLGAAHTFQNGIGMTGGIMDYGDARIAGQIQFNSQYSRSSMCDTLTRMKTSVDREAQPFCMSALAVLSQCGNEIVEEGEECDDSSPCCSDCRFVGAATCSPGADSPKDECCVGCQMQPSTTSCLNGMGFCSTQGHCELSVCNDYAGLAFCGVSQSNPCQQKCRILSSNECANSSRIQGVPMNVDESVVCSLSPFSTCHNTNGRSQCVPMKEQVNGSSAFWRANEWTACTGAECGLGWQTRYVSCIDSNSGKEVADSVCLNIKEKPATNQTCDSGFVCASYSWHVQQDWSKCEFDCGTSNNTQSRSVGCVNQFNDTVSDNLCPSIKPNATRPCQPEPAECPLNYYYSAFSACSALCGSNGTQSAQQTCMLTRSAQLYPTADDACTKAGLKPDSTVQQRECNRHECGRYALSYSDWSLCSLQSSQQQRSVVCVDSFDLQTQGLTQSVDMALCSEHTVDALTQDCIPTTSSTASDVTVLDQNGQPLSDAGVKQRQAEAAAAAAQAERDRLNNKSSNTMIAPIAGGSAAAAALLGILIACLCYRHRVRLARAEAERKQREAMSPSPVEVMSPTQQSLLNEKEVMSPMSAVSVNSVLVRPQQRRLSILTKPAALQTATQSLSQSRRRSTVGPHTIVIDRIAPLVGQHVTRTSLDDVIDVASPTMHADNVDDDNDLRYLSPTHFHAEEGEDSSSFEISESYYQA